MINLIQRKLGLKISILTNIILFIVTVIGAAFLYYQQNNLFDKQLVDKGKMASIIGAKAVGRILEEAIDNGVLTLSEVMDTNYEEIPGFDPPKFHTKYDRYTDRAFLSLQDEFLKTTDLLYAATLDVNGYVPTHNTRFSKAITGEKQKDLLGNRTKRIFKDEVSMRAQKNTQEGFLQEYSRDTGEMTWDISTPVYVKGKHWGCFRVGFALTAINQTKLKLLISLGLIGFAIFMISTTTVFVIINHNLRPLTEFTRVASDLADGHMDEKIKWETKDEIGKLADVLERLRISLKAAMERLSR